jgi:arylsulfatase A-like enzyme
MANRPPLSRRQIGKVDRSFRRRVRAVQAVDDLIGRLRAQLRARGIDRNTYFVFASDNGYHTGEHRLLPGKMTAFDSDIRVPLVVVGPGVPRGRKTSLIAENVDLYPTFLRLAGVSPHPGYDGHSLVPLLRSQSAKGWRTAALVEHHGPDFAEGDPDRPPPGAGNPTSYKALRLPNAVYVEYAGSQREFYNLRKDPYELNNVYGALSAAERRRLHLRVQRLARCRGARSCWHAAGGRSASG